MTKLWAKLFFDGGTGPTNPGESVGAAVLTLPSGEVHTVAERIGWATNNEAEWSALVFGLQLANSLGVKHLQVYGDSQLVINQVSHRWRVHAANLRPYYAEAREAVECFQSCEFEWVPREQNTVADALCNQVFREAGLKTYHEAQAEGQQQGQHQQARKQRRQREEQAVESYTLNPDSLLAVFSKPATASNVFKAPTLQQGTLTHPRRRKRPSALAPAP